MVAAGAAVDPRRAAELAGDDEQDVVVQPAVVDVLDERRGERRGNKRLDTVDASRNWAGHGAQIERIGAVAAFEEQTAGERRTERLEGDCVVAPAAPDDDAAQAARCRRECRLSAERGVLEELDVRIVRAGRRTNDVGIVTGRADGGDDLPPQCQAIHVDIEERIGAG